MRDRRCSGFSLIEVMIVVVIIGILAALAYPSLEGYLQRTRQAEAKTNLSALYTAQKIYFATKRTYASNLSDLDVQFETGGEVVYSYTLTATATTFVATATGNLDDDAALDTWTIDQGKTLTNTVNDLTAE
ncbi:MAG: prepilin-type N-terminal cleavage/methylation domain-containing protein [SAR324 cluster bacterium]|nr:prepilin-type N-terminal cleavage/methylation domain-containing protein [SAR324 cluster bacterium]